MELSNVNSYPSKGMSNASDVSANGPKQQAFVQEATDVKRATQKPNENMNLVSTKESVVQLADQMNASLEPLSESVKFEFDEKLGGFFINVVDTKSGAIIRRFPSEEAAELAGKMRELVGMIFDAKA